MSERKSMKSLTRKQTVAARARKHTAVFVPTLVPWRSPEHLYVTHPTQVKSMRRVMKQVHDKATRVHAMLVHGRGCDLTISVFPLDAGDDHAKSRADVACMRERCSCEPLVMYTGARA